MHLNDIFLKTFIGTSGFIASMSLANISEFISILVGLATLGYMITSIIKTYKSIK